MRRPLNQLKESAMKRSFICLGTVLCLLFMKVPVTWAESPKPWVIYIKQDACHACAVFEHEVLSQRPFKAALNDDLHLVTVNIDTQDRLTLPGGDSVAVEDFLARTQIVGSPALIFFNANDEPVLVRQGSSHSSVSLALAARYVQERAYETMPFGLWVKAQPLW